MLKNCFAAATLATWPKSRTRASEIHRTQTGTFAMPCRAVPPQAFLAQQGGYKAN